MALAAIGSVGRDAVRWESANSALNLPVRERNESTTDENWMASEGNAWTRQTTSESDEESELRGPERFFYDTSTYTGVHRYGGPCVKDLRADDCHRHGDRFEYLRRQFERRHQFQAEERERAMAEVDKEEFKNDPYIGTGDGEIYFELCGAIPPTSNRRARDAAASAAITRSEREAATELIRKGVEAEAARVKECAEAVRRWERVKGRGFEICDRRVMDSPSPRPSEIHSVPPTPNASSSKNELGIENAEADLKHTDGKFVQAKPALSPTGTSQFLFKDWETRITEFYKKWEAHKDQEEVVRLQTRDEEFEARRLKEAQERKFELDHRHCETKILASKRRLDVNNAHKKYKDTVEVSLVTDDILRKRAIIERKEAAAAERERATAAKALRIKTLNFVAQGAVLDKTCRSIDAQQVRAEERARACENVAELQEKWAAKTARARGRRTLQEAQQRMRDASHRGRVLYMAKIARDHQEQREEEMRQRISAERNFRSCVRLARKGLETHENTYKAESTDLQQYEDSLRALRELAEAVQEHGRLLRDRTHEEDYEDALINMPAQLGPLSAAEPRIRAMLGLSASPEEGEDAERDLETETPTTRATSAGYTLDKTLLPASRKDTPRTSPAAMKQTSPAGFTESTVASPSPAPPSRPRSQMGMSPLVVRPLRAICQQLDGKRSRTPNKAAARKEMQSLAALRKIRQTGPLIKR